MSKTFRVGELEIVNAARVDEKGIIHYVVGLEDGSQIRVYFQQGKGREDHMYRLSFSGYDEITNKDMCAIYHFLKNEPAVRLSFTGDLGGVSDETTAIMRMRPTRNVNINGRKERNEWISIFKYENMRTFQEMKEDIAPAIREITQGASEASKKTIIGRIEPFLWYLILRNNALGERWTGDNFDLNVIDEYEKYATKISKKPLLKSGEEVSQGVMVQAKKSLYRIMIEQGRLTEDEKPKVDPIIRNPHIENKITASKIEEIIETWEEDIVEKSLDWEGQEHILAKSAKKSAYVRTLRTRAMGFLIIACGLTHIDLVDLKIDDFDADANTLKVRGRKGRGKDKEEERIFSLPPRVSKAISYYLQMRRPVIAALFASEEISLQFGGKVERPISVQLPYRIFTPFELTTEDFERNFIASCLARDLDLTEIKKMANSDNKVMKMAKKHQDTPYVDVLSSIVW